MPVLPFGNAPAKPTGRVLSGIGAPSSNFGNDGDWYVDLAGLTTSTSGSVSLVSTAASVFIGTNLMRVGLWVTNNSPAETVVVGWDNTTPTYPAGVGNMATLTPLGGTWIPSPMVGGQVAGTSSSVASGTALVTWIEV